MYRTLEGMVSMKITYKYTNYGKGYPGYNHQLTAMRKGEQVGYASFPNVNGPTFFGIFAGEGEAWARELADKMESGETREVGE